MKYYTCKCGSLQVWTTDGLQPCQGCEKCNTILGSFEKPIPHEEQIIYNQLTGKPDYIRCKRCGQRLRKIEGKK